MIAIVDSGSTKSNWVVLDQQMNEFQFKTVGINPYYQNAEEIFKLISETILPHLPNDVEVEALFYYGAGCERISQREIVKQGLQRAFPKTNIEVDHDMLAAARALFGNQPGIACIAGTGANTCYYNGKAIEENIYSPGLALGDEGSGGFLGKMLARDYIRKALPEELMLTFEAFTKDRTADILDSVYKKPFPNRYLASFAPFVSQNIDHPFMFQMAYENFEELFRRCICRYKQYKELPIRFIGSLAANLQAPLEKAAKEKGATIDLVVANPMRGLIDFHLKGYVVKGES